MPFAGLYVLRNEPIIISKMIGYISLEDAQRATEATSEAITRLHQFTYVIVDVTDVRSDFGQVMAIMRDQREGELGSPTEARSMVMLVGLAALVKLFVEGMSKTENGGVHIPLFTTMDDALIAARLMVSQEQQTA
jgi:hypothetical protein